MVSCPRILEARQFKVPAGGKTVYRMARHQSYNMNHKEDFFQAVRAGRKPCMDIEAGRRAGSICILGNLAWLPGGKLHRNGEERRFIGDPSRSCVCSSSIMRLSES